MRAVNANIFAAVALCFAASKQEYSPKVLASLHYSDGEDEASYYRHAFQNYPSPIRGLIIRFAAATSTLRLKRNIPVYTMTFNGCLTRLYIIVSIFNGPVTFVYLSTPFPLEHFGRLRYTQSSKRRRRRHIPLLDTERKSHYFLRHKRRRHSSLTNII